jgi:hypothetical protein
MAGSGCLSMLVADAEDDENGGEFDTVGAIGESAFGKSSALPKP